MEEQYAHANFPAFKVTIDEFVQKGIIPCFYSGDNIISRVRKSLSIVREVFGKDSFEDAKREVRYYRNVAHASEDKEESDGDITRWSRFLT